MIGDHLPPMIRRHFRIPLLLGSGQTFVEILKTFLKISGVAGIHFSQLAGNSLGNAPTVIGIEPVMRVAQGVHVAHGARDLARGNIENLSELRGIQVALSGRLDFSIAALRDQRRQPSDFQIEPD